MKTTLAVWRGLAGSARRLSAVSLVLAGLSGSNARADSTFVYAVQISAQVQAWPPQITLNWEPDPYGATNYTVYRKLKADTAWGAPLAYLTGDSTNYTDATVLIGTPYEYQIVKAASLGYTGYGYIFSGIDVPAIEQRGIVVLLVASESTVGLDSELARLQTDLVGDGWQVLRHDVSTNDTPDDVRLLILDDYWASPDRVNAVFLLGHVPILQSGYLDYDGHGARAMPADAFYGDVYFDWPTDLTNSPSYLPSDVPLMVGRVDLFDMPGNGAPNPWPSETELLRNYLNKDHAWRQKQIYVERRALMGNRFGDDGGLASAASGYRNFAPIVGPGNTIEADIDDNAPVPERWMPMLAAGSYLWAYGNGGGLDNAIGYLGTNGIYNEVWSTDIVDQDAQVVFVMMFGSHFGNWDHTDDIMRSVLATPSMGVACCMSGEPHWYFHHMGLGETTGYSTRLTMNNSTLYRTQTNYFTRAVYIALMGDPTLRLEPVSPPANFGVTAAGAVSLNWTPSSDPSLAGYYVYRADSPDGPFVRLNAGLLAQTSYIDASVPSGTYTYMVRAVALVTNPSGSYFDPSQGIFATVTTTGAPQIIIQTSLATGGLQLTWNSQVGSAYHVQCANRLSPISWSDLSSPIIATDSTTSWTDPTALFQNYRFYRISSP
jgi:hypothetical protein